MAVSKIKLHKKGNVERGKIWDEEIFMTLSGTRLSM